jgi:hypothetical protein
MSLPASSRLVLAVQILRYEQLDDDAIQGKEGRSTVGKPLSYLAKHES